MTAALSVGVGLESFTSPPPVIFRVLVPDWPTTRAEELFHCEPAPLTTTLPDDPTLAAIVPPLLLTTPPP